MMSHSKPRLPGLSHSIHRRQSSGGSTSPKTGAIAIGIIAGAVILVFGTCLLLRYLRGRYYNPRFIPTRTLKRRWRQWTPPNVIKANRASLLPPPRPPTAAHGVTPTTQRPSSSHSHRFLRHFRETVAPPNIPAPAVEQRPATASSELPDRHTSVRSIMTLPVYTTSPRPNERVLGREGERSGIDMVVEFPETVDEEELRREQEMESLYQIRVARRTERAERDERRRARAEARAAGDIERLAQLREQRRLEREARDNNNNNNNRSGGVGGEGAAAMMEAHNGRQRERGRKVSEVKYADVGLARHDGSRVRADSDAASDAAPLLEGAEGMGRAAAAVSATRPRPSFAGTVSSSLSSTSTGPPTARSGRGGTTTGGRWAAVNQSTSSLGRIMTLDVSDGDDDEADGRSSAEGTPWASRSQVHLQGVAAAADSAAASSSPLMSPPPPPPSEPPRYYDGRTRGREEEEEQAPAYESPVDDRRHPPPPPVLPTIEVSGAAVFPADLMGGSRNNDIGSGGGVGR